MIRIVAIALPLLISLNVMSQSAEEIIKTYFENIGGLEKWQQIEGIKYNVKINMGGMYFPMELVQLKDGRQYSKFEVQGNEIMQKVYDGKTVWGTNFQTMKPEKADAVTTEITKLDANDFPSEFMDYKNKGYVLELLGKEMIDGLETYKLKLTKEPIVVDGKETQDVKYYYFDTEMYIPIAEETAINVGPNKGVISMAKLGDYRFVEGLYIPFTLYQGVKGSTEPFQPIKVESIEINPVVDKNIFVFPGD